MQFLETMGNMITKYSGFFIEGVENTLILSFFTVLFGTILGTLMAMARMSKFAPFSKFAPLRKFMPLRWLATAYIEFFRGTPLMVQLMFIFYGLPMIGVTFPTVSFIPDFDRFAAGVVAMSLNSCAYVAEVIRSGIQAVDKGQMEGARSCGMTNAQAMRYVVMPQAVKNILPAIGNEMIALLKETSVAGYVAVQDLTKAGDIIRSRTYSAFMPLIAVALIYLIVVMFFTWLVGKLERRLRASDH